MTYIAELRLIPEMMPPFLNEWLMESLPVDLTVKACILRGTRMLLVMIEASTPEDLEAKRKAFNHMLEAAGYGPKANK